MRELFALLSRIDAPMWIAIWLILNLFAIISYDTLCIWTGRYEDTVSAVIQSWCRQVPILAFIIGAVVFHLLAGARPPIR